MKKTGTKLMLSLAFIATLTIGVISNANAKFWGTKILSTTDWADGECTYRETCTVHYIFWIAGEEKCNTEKLYCLGVD